MLVIVLLSIASGFWILFVAVPTFAIWLVLSAMLGAVLTASMGRIWRVPASPVGMMAAAAAMALLLFAVLPLYIVLFAPATDGGLLFH